MRPARMQALCVADGGQTARGSCCCASVLSGCRRSRCDAKRLTSRPMGGGCLEKWRVRRWSCQAAVLSDGGRAGSAAIPCWRDGNSAFLAIPDTSAAWRFASFYWWRASTERFTSYISRLPATPAFSESTAASMGMRTRCEHRADSRGCRPRRSSPTAIRQPRG